MNTFKCFDVVKMVTAEATAQFAPLFYENPIKLSHIEHLCSYIDFLIEKYNGISCNVEINSISLEIKVTITFQTDEFLLPKDLACHSQISFHSINNKFIDLEFLFPGIWSKISSKEVSSCLL